MARVILLPLAERDLEDIWNTIAADNPRAATKLINKFFARFNALAQFPDMGSPRPDLGEGMRLLVEWPYVAAYRQTEPGVVTVVRVLHGARDLADAL